MKAILRSGYGPPDILRLEEVAKPVPKDDQVLVKIHAASLNAYDWHMLTADIFLVRFMGGGLRRPKNPMLGADLAGRVEAVGSRVTQFKPGDAVYGDMAGHDGGSFAEYAAVAERALAPKPAALSFEEAAAVPMAAVTALQGLRDAGKIQAGQRVLINGASGGVGTFALQLAKVFGAEVTAVCSSRNVDQARQLGADHVIDYTQENFTRSGKTYDLILGANGHHPLSAYKRALAPKGIYVMAGGTMGQIFQAMLLGPLMSEKTGRKMSNITAHVTQQDLGVLTQLLESGQIRSVIDKTYPLHEVPDAMRYLGQGHARGKIVISVV